MQLSKFDYYSDYVVYPIVFVALAGMGLARNGRHEELMWWAAASIGALLWTLAEYLIHRFAMHQNTYFAPMHGEHHAAPLAYIGTPTWISMLTLGTVVFLPAWGAFGFNIASGLFAGLTAGYVWYGAVHHLIHHWRDPPPLAVVRELRARHMRHHYWPQRGNFGVTTALWDRVFGTLIRSGRPG